MDQTFPHRKAKLKYYKGLLNKRWYIEYYVWDETNSKLVRRRFYKGFEQFTTFQTRYDYGMATVRKLNNILPKSCINKIKSRALPQVVPGTSPGMPMIKHINDSLDLLIDGTSTKLHYASTIRQFEAWLKSTGSTRVSFKYFKRKNAQLYVDYLHLDRKVSAITIANQISHLKAQVNKIIDREDEDNPNPILKKNPFIGLKLPKIIETERNYYYSKELIETIKKHCLTHDPFLWVVAQFIYYSYMRIVELGRVQLKRIKNNCWGLSINFSQSE